MKNCNCETEINRDGSGQLQRYLKALDPSYAPIDGRSTEDLLVFAKRYAAQIRFYDISENSAKDGQKPKKLSWREFFRRDMSVIAASIALTHAKGFKDEYDEVYDRLQKNPSAEIYGALYAPIVGMLKKIDRWLTVAIPDNPLHQDIHLAIESDLKMQVHKIMAYEDGFKYVDPNFDLGLGLDDVENKDVWGLLDTIPPDASIYKGATPEQRILSAALFVEDIFHAFYSFIKKLVDESTRYIHFANKEYPGHQPHMALFITFLQLFRKAQDQLNGLTGRMLDFYYKDVLHLEGKPSVPDKVHIVFELAKDVAEYDLASGTGLKAGPDLAGKDQVYKTTEDLVVNQSKIKELKTIFVQKNRKGATSASDSVHSIFARPVANSADGYGEKFEDDDVKWPTFGLGIPSKTKPANPCERIEQIKSAAKRNDQASIGFAFASPQLVLQGGKRLIQIRFNETASSLFAKYESLTAKNSESLFEFSFTGEKEWFVVNTVMNAVNQARFTKYLPIDTFNPATNDIEASYFFVKVTNPLNGAVEYVLSVYLPPAAPAIIEYNSKLHSAFSFQTVQPVMQVRLNSEIDLNAKDYNDLSVDDLILQTKVGSVLPVNFHEQLKKLGINPTFEEEYYFDRFPADGLNKLFLQNDTGVVAIGKPFDPFTAYPDKGKSFYVGSHEVFNKPLGQLAVVLKRTAESDIVVMPFNFSTSEFSNVNAGTFDVNILENRNWVELKTPFGDQFTQASLKSNILFTPKFQGEDDEPTMVEHKHERLPILPVAEWKPETEKGFLRLTNLVAVASGNNYLENSQNLAHQLELKEVSLSYSSTLTSLMVGVDEFYHLYPFGTIETYIGASATKEGSIESNQVSANTITKIRSYLGNSAFAKLDSLKANLLVNANNTLLPQFTYLNPYDQYEDTTTKVSSAAARKSMKRKTGDAIAEQLLLSASGLNDELSGGANQYSNLIQEEGMLFIGIEKAQPLHMISMLFQFAEGSAEDEENDPPEIHWSYLTNNEWRPMKAEHIVTDGTSGFQTTGIIKVELPADATDNNTIVSSGLHWLCASVTSDSIRIPMLIDIATQAVMASFNDQDNDQSHFDQALPAASISKLVTATAQIAKVAQPFASYDGKHKEVGKEFYARVSERLRHKQRAITAWDYEHLVLNRFPSIYKVKCITHTDPECLCRKPEEIKVSRNESASGKKLAGEIAFSFKEGTLDFASKTDQKRLSNFIKKLQSSGVSPIKLTGSYEKTSNLSVDLNKKRVEFISKELDKNGITNDRYTVTLLEEGEKNRITLSDAAGALKEDPSSASYTLNANACCGPQVAPGHVLIVPVSNLKNRNAVNPLQPKTARRVLLDIESYLKERSSPFVKIHAMNPVYEQVLVFFRVKFHQGFDKGFHLKKLNEEIVHYLTPWAFDELTEVNFGQKIYASSIVNFIEERPYVNFITDFLMVVCRKACCEEVIGEEDEQDDEDILNRIKGCSDMEILLQDNTEFLGDIVAKPSTPRSLLVSVPRHIIVPYREPKQLPPCQKLKIRKEEANEPISKDELVQGLEGRVKPLDEIQSTAVTGQPATAVVNPATGKDEKDTVTVSANPPVASTGLTPTATTTGLESKGSGKGTSGTTGGKRPPVKRPTKDSFVIKGIRPKKK